MRVNLLDPALMTTHGHHLEYALGIVAELARRRIETHVYSYRKTDAAVLKAFASRAAITPLFKLGPYAEPAKVDPICGELSLYQDGALLLGMDLTRVAPADVWIWPSFFAAQLYACTIAKPTALISGCIHVEPTYKAPNGRMWWRHAFIKAHNAKLRLNLGVTGSTALQQEYAPLLKQGRIHTFPIAHDGAPIPACKSALKRIGFFGDQGRQRKGVTLLPQLIPLLAEDGYELVIQDSSDSVQATGGPGLTMLSYIPDFAEEIAKCDLIVVPYDPEAYRHMGSGIVWDALASGVPVIAPAGTAPGAYVQKTGAGLLFDPFTVEGVHRAIQVAKQDYPRIAQAAFQVSRAWPATNGMQHFVTALLGDAAGAKPGPAKTKPASQDVLTQP